MEEGRGPPPPQPARALARPRGAGRARHESSVWHAGIALSRDFMIHSSSQGAYVSPLWETWRRDEFSWARRVV